MAFQGPLGGVAFLKIDGVQYQLRGSMTVYTGGLVATGVAGQDAVHGYTEKPGVPYIDAELGDSGGLSVLQLQGIRNSTITAELSNGKVYALRNAWTSGEVVADTEKASLKLKWEGMSCQEIGVSGS